MRADIASAIDLDQAITEFNDGQMQPRRVQQQQQQQQQQARPKKNDE